MNKIWTILDGLRDTPVFGDYRRLTELSGLHVSTETKEMVNSVINIQDPYLRGFIVEAIVQAALVSNYKNELLSFDPINTYTVPIIVHRSNSVESVNGKAKLAILDVDSTTYKCSGSVDRYDNSVLLTVNGKTEYTELSPTIKISTNAILQYPSIDDVVNTSFTVYSLPKDPPLTIFFNSLKSRYPNLAVNTNAIDASGKFIHTLINK